MGLVSRLTAGPATRAGEPKATTTLLTDGFPSFSSTGKNVNVWTASGLPAVWAAVWLIADQAGSLPLRVYNTRGDARTPSPGAWQQRLLNAPNPESTAMDLWTVAIAHLDLWGNAFLGKTKVGGRVVALWNISPERVVIIREQGRKLYRVTNDVGATKVYAASDVIHIRGRSLDGMVGLSPISHLRNTLGISLALDDFAGTTLKNRAVPLGILSIKDRITKTETRDNIRQDWKDKFRGVGGEIAILDEGAEFQPISMPFADAQFIEQRKMGIQDIARIFGIPAELIGGESGGSMTYSNVSARRSDLLQFVLWSRLRRIEQSLFADLDLFPNTGGLEARFDDSDFLRGDPEDQYKALRFATGGKQVLTQDEARKMLGLVELGGDAAKLESQPTPLVPTPADGPLEGPAPADATAASEAP